ncbi:MAG: helix-turn-helix domain-containing protein [Methylocystis sp.]|nr:helix-turn-helix domain-containing protein [Methylocystis sp.]
MITAAQLRAARALAGLDQRKLADLSGLSLPTIQRMETSEGLIRGNVDSLTKLIAALEGWSCCGASAPCLRQAFSRSR